MASSTDYWKEVIVNMKKTTGTLVSSLTLFMLAIMPMAGIPQSKKPSSGPPPKHLQGEPSQAVVSQTLPESVPEGILQVFSGKSIAVSSLSQYEGCSVANPEVATYISISTNQVLLNGLKVGNTTLICWDTKLIMHSYDVQVRADLEPLRNNLRQHFPEEDIRVNPAAGSLVLSGTVSSPAMSAQAEALAKTESAAIVNMLRTPDVSDRSIVSLRETMVRVFPKENIQVDFSGNAVVLYGTASSPDIAARAEAIAKTESKEVVNAVRIRHISDVILLRVRFAEIERAAVQDLGISIFGTAGNTVGAFSATQKNLAGGASINKSGTSAAAAVADVINIALLRQDIDVGVLIKALEQRNLAQILAEPNLLTLSGKEASFHAGGEIPIPISQGTGNAASITVEWKQFGVRLNFIAEVLPDNMINMKVEPEVSALDYTHAIKLPGADDPIPALVIRKAKTEVELMNGQSFAIAGLIDNRITELANKIPGLGDIPILGTLFRSKSTNRTNTELVVLVTPQLVKPFAADQPVPGPAFPRPFIDSKEFDGTSGASPAPNNAKQP
jgi:Flp pilus assembly secretin CpaC